MTSSPLASKWKLWSLVAVFVLAATFLLQNTRVVEVRFLFWKVGMSRALMLLGALALGFAGGWLLSRLRAPR